MRRAPSRRRRGGESKRGEQQTSSRRATSGSGEVSARIACHRAITTNIVSRVVKIGVVEVALVDVREAESLESRLQRRVGKDGELKVGVEAGQLCMGHEFVRAV